MSRSVRGPVDNRNAGLLGPSAYRWSDEEKRRLGTVLGRINGHPARGSTSCSPGIGKAGLPDWLHKRCLRGGDHGKRIEGFQASRFI